MNNKKFRIYSKLIENWVTDSWVENLCSPDLNTFNDIFNNKNLIFQQYTGFNDKNNKPIYEGDKLMWKEHMDWAAKVPNITLHLNRYVGTVLFKNGKFVIKGKYNDYDLNSFSYKIIGNILEK